ncbi:MAG: hypothetical protein ACLFWD_07340 [Anaerolineales bacterium]
MAIFMLLLDYSRRHSLKLSPLTWGLTILGLLFAVFVIEVIASFIAEGAGQAALVTGVILGLVAAIWATLLGRFGFSAAAR